MKDRILKFIQKEGITPAHFADEIGVQRSSVSHILSGRNNPSFDFIQKILQRYGSINAEWLIMGSGEMFKRPDKPVFSPPFSQKSVSPAVQKDLFSDPPPLQSDPPPVYGQEKAPVAPVNKSVEKIIVFYSDKTFSEFKPSV